MLIRGRICEKFLKQKLERKVVASLVAGKILRSTEISLLLFIHVDLCMLFMHVKKQSCEYLLCTYNHSAIKVIKILK